jgi:hypothetical protein
MYNILLYSKYSSKCKSIIDMLSIIQLETINLTMLCIDNEDIRIRIRNSNNIKIDTVPCILTIFPDGGVEKYDKNSVFNWVEEIIQKVKPNIQQNEENEENDEKSSKNYKNDKNDKNNRNDRNDKNNRNDRNDENNDNIDKVREEISKTKVTDLSSLIDENDEDDQEEQEENVIPANKQLIKKRPPVSLRSETGNVELTDEFEEEDKIEMKVTKGLKKPGKKNEVSKNLIEEMQRQREIDDGKMFKKKNRPI